MLGDVGDELAHAVALMDAQLLGAPAAEAPLQLDGQHERAEATQRAPPRAATATASRATSKRSRVMR